MNVRDIIRTNSSDDVIFLDDILDGVFTDYDSLAVGDLLKVIDMTTAEIFIHTKEYDILDEDSKPIYSLIKMRKLVIEFLYYKCGENRLDMLIWE